MCYPTQFGRKNNEDKKMHIPKGYLFSLLDRRGESSGNTEEKMVEVHDFGYDRYRSQLSGNQGIPVHHSDQCAGESKCACVHLCACASLCVCMCVCVEVHSSPFFMASVTQSRLHL